MFKYIILFMFFYSAAACQNERHIKNLFEDNYSDNREKYLMKLSKERHSYWFNKYVKEVGVDTTSGNTMEQIENAIFFADLNHDTFPDIIDESNNGTAPVLIYLTQKDSFIQIIDEAQARLKEIRYIGNKTEIITQVLGMVDYFVGESIYTLTNDSIHLEKFRTRRNCTRAPQDYFKQPLSIQTVLDDSPLRENPQIAKGECFIDTGKKEYNDKNNILERLPKHTKGRAWGESHDIKGQKWLLIEIASNEFSNYKTYLVGWIKANEVEEIEK